MIKEDYCSFEVAKLLKEKGFDVPCHYAYHGGIKIPDFHRHLRNFNGEEYTNLRNEWYSAPTHQMAMKWLREKHVIITIVPAYFNSEQCASWDIDIWADDNYEHLFEDYPSYEEAVEAALKYCLTELI